MSPLLAITAAHLVIAVVVGLAAGVLAGLFGVGGGILFVPALALTLGLEQHQAQATSLLAILPTVAVGTWRQARYGNVRWNAALVLGIAGIGGVVAGGLLAESLSGSVLRRLFGVLLVLTAGQLGWRAWRQG
jgi:uncharacterized membrane protein YfcA